jgi:tetratricopeptide (TPR) repeat protein
MKRLALALLLLGAAGCATSGAFRAGESAERLQDYDRAVLEYQRAVKAAPDNVQYRRALERARLRASTDHTNMARRLAGRGLSSEALDEYRLALELNPDAPGVVEESPSRTPRPGPASTPCPGSTWGRRRASRSASSSGERACASPTSPWPGRRGSTSPSTRRSRTRPFPSTSRTWASSRP